MALIYDYHKPAIVLVFIVYQINYPSNTRFTLNLQMVNQPAGEMPITLSMIPFGTPKPGRVAVSASVFVKKWATILKPQAVPERVRCSVIL